jgi:uncharacterized protein (DUF983 family)
MVTKEKIVERFVLLYPKCPVCGAKKGYKALDAQLFVKMSVQCRSCGAKLYYKKDGEKGS